MHVDGGAGTQVQLSPRQRAVEVQMSSGSQLVLLSLQGIQDVLVSDGSAALVLGSVPALLSSAASGPTRG